MKKILAIGLVLIIAGVSLFSFFFVKERRKLADGELVECTVTSSSRVGKNYDYYGYYIDDSGKAVDVEIVNGKKLRVDDTIEAYVLPDDPDTAHVKSSGGLILLIGIISAVVSLGGVALVIAAVKSASEDKHLELDGGFAQGEIVGVRHESVGNTSFWFAKISYTDSTGAERTFEDCSDNYKRSRVGDKVNVKYAQKKNGKYVHKVG